ncbi:MAG TPA: glycerate kinase, partial [Candidatus Baltobacteraceae bacterium]|nr:glycerate kinase [Candidatus Baltobacteraceae bacterium]
MTFVVIAPDKFKGALTALQAARAIERGVKRASPDVDCKLCPMADGGEGTVEAFLDRGAQRRTARVRGPLGKPVEAVFAVDKDTAIVEMSSASGLGLLDKSKHDPTKTDTFGTGGLISAALSAGARRIIIGLGGSATNDAGTGMLRALGARFLDANGDELREGILTYARLASIDLDALDTRVRNVQIDAAVDVDNPLCGPTGASYMFAAQKGATPEQIERLDAVLDHIADIASKTLGHDERNTPGAGAAGGLGFALTAFLNANLERGVKLIADEAGLPEMMRGASLCMTGEGKIDMQTLHGKTVDGVARIAGDCDVPVIAFGGKVEDDAKAALAERGIKAVQTAPSDMPADQAMARAAEFLEEA